MRLRTSILAALTAICLTGLSDEQVFAQAAAAIRTSQSAGEKIEAAIWKLGLLSPESKLWVQIEDKQALVTIYSGTHEKAADALIKIDAVLIAKCVFDNAQETLRTKVGFGTPVKGNTRTLYLRQVNISKGDIKAFAGKQLSKSDLLASLEITRLSRTLGTKTPIARKDTITRQEQLETLDTSGASKGRITSFREPRTGLTVNYPSQWKLVGKPDVDTLFRIDAPTCAIEFGVDSSPGLPVKQAARMWESVILPQMPGFTLISSNRVKLGQNGSLDGLTSVVEFSVNDIVMKQRWIFFGQTGSVFHVVISSPKAAETEGLPDIHQMLMSLKFTGGTLASQGSPAQKEIQPWSRLSLFQDGPVTINYPEGWQVNKFPEPEVLVKLHGKTESGEADLQIRRSIVDRTTSLDEIAETVETNYLKQLKSFRRIRQEHVGLPGGVSGVLQEFTFEASGLPFRQVTVYRREADHLYTLSLTAFNWKQSDMLTLFNRCLGTWVVRE